MDHTEYPECEKLSAVSDERRTLSEFFEWLSNQGMFLHRYEGDSGRPWPVTTSTDRLIMQFLEIDEDKLEQERRAMLAGQREEQSEPTCEHPKDLYAPYCADIFCPNYAGRFSREGM